MVGKNIVATETAVVLGKDKREKEVNIWKNSGHGVCSTFLFNTKETQHIFLLRMECSGASLFVCEYQNTKESYSVEDTVHSLFVESKVSVKVPHEFMA